MQFKVKWYFFLFEYSAMDPGPYLLIYQQSGYQKRTNVCNTHNESINVK